MDASTSVTVFGFVGASTSGPARRKPQRSRSLLSESLRASVSDCQLSRAFSSESCFSDCDDSSEAPSAASSHTSSSTLSMERASSGPIAIHDSRSAARIERANIKGQQRELLQHVRSWLRDNQPRPVASQ